MKIKEAKKILKNWRDNNLFASAERREYAITVVLKELKKNKKVLKANPIFAAIYEMHTHKPTEEKKVDFSILNNNDWFYVYLEARGNNNNKWLCKGDPRINGITYNIGMDKIYDNSTCLCSNESDYALLRKATKEEIIEYIYKNDSSLIPDNFTDWWVGQYVWCVARGEGVIIRINEGETYPIVVEFKCGTSSSNKNGMYVIGNLNRSLYPYPIEVKRIK